VEDHESRIKANAAKALSEEAIQYLAEALTKIDWVAPEMVEPSTPVILDSKRTLGQSKPLAPAPVAVEDKPAAEITAKPEESKSLLLTQQEKKEATGAENSIV
jgi:hypothetical protein